MANKYKLVRLFDGIFIMKSYEKIDIFLKIVSIFVQIAIPLILYI